MQAVTEQIEQISKETDTKAGRSKRKSIDCEAKLPAIELDTDKENVGHEDLGKSVSPVVNKRYKSKASVAPKKRGKKAVAKIMDDIDNVLAETETIASTDTKKSSRRKRPTDSESITSLTKKSKHDSDTLKENISTSQISVLFTGIDDTALKATDLLQKIGVRIVDSWSECTHLCSDKIKRTTKFLAALSAGKKIVSVDWVKACLKQKKLVDITTFPLKDTAGEKKHSFNLSTALENVEKNGPSALMSGLQFLITPSTSPSYVDLMEMIEAAGGVILNDLPMRVINSIYIIGCKEDAALVKQYQQSGWTDHILLPEFVMACSLKQELDFDSHRYTKHKRSH